MKKSYNFAIKVRTISTILSIAAFIMFVASPSIWENSDNFMMYLVTAISSMGIMILFGWLMTCADRRVKYLRRKMNSDER